MGGGGGAWKENQSGILDHARDLHYDDYLAESGGALPSTDADKATWTSAMDKFNAWKARERAKPAGQAWWQTYEAPSEGGSEGGSSGGSGSGLPADLGIGPYPLDNMYFPQLTHAYETPQAQDWSQYGLLDPNYQPWTEQGGQQFVPENIWNYAPPQINRQPVQYSGPPMGGLMEVAAHGPSSGNKSPMTSQEMIESGLYDGRPGYRADGKNMPTFTDTMKSLFDLDDFEKSLDRIGQINSGSEGVDPDPTAGDDTFGLGISP